jgi:hypothetical protein
MIRLEVGEHKTQAKKSFPKFMTLADGRGGIFLFLEETRCVCLEKENLPPIVWAVGEYYTNAFPSYFVDFNEPITFQNQ